MGGVLVGAAAVGARGEREQHAPVGEQAVELVEERDLVGDVLEEVDGPDDADAAVGEVDALGHVGDDVDTGAVVLVDTEVARWLVVGGAEVEGLETPAFGPGQRVGLDVAVVEDDRLALDAGVDVG